MEHYFDARLTKAEIRDMVDAGPRTMVRYASRDTIEFWYQGLDDKPSTSILSPFLESFPFISSSTHNLSTHLSLPHGTIDPISPAWRHRAHEHHYPLTTSRQAILYRHIRLRNPKQHLYETKQTAFEALPDKTKPDASADVEMQGARPTATTQATRPRGNQRRSKDDFLDIPAAILLIGWFAVFFLNLNTPARKQNESCVDSIDYMFLRTGGWAVFYLLAVPIILKIAKRHPPAGVRRSWVAGVVLAFIMVALPVTVITEAVLLYVKYPCPASGESKPSGTL